MPETAVAPEPVAAPAAAPEPTPSPAPPPSDAVGEMDSMLAEFNKKPATTTTPPPETPKPTDKTPEKPAAPDKPVSGPAQLRKRLEEIEKEYGGFKMTAAQEQEKLKRQIAEYEKRPYLTPEQQARQDALAQRFKQLEAELFARDYRESPEFAEKYQKKWESLYTQAVKRINGATIEFENPETGEKQTRRLSASDFNAVRTAPPEQQLDLAEKLFGRHAFIVMQDINALKTIEDAANEDVVTRQKNYHADRQRMQAESQQLHSAFQNAHSEIDRQLVEKYPAYFGDDPQNPDATNAMKKGIELVDKTLAEADTIPLPERAARAALIRRWAASFPRMVVTIKQLQDQLKAKDEELAKYRGSDPGGAGKPGAPSGKADDDDPNIDALVKQFE